MLLRNAYARFFRAFNFDYLRKAHPGAQPDPWDAMPDGEFYPYVCLDIDRELTAVVGANESGKSQILDAIEHCLGDRSAAAADFCRYSDYFTVAESMRTPHFGLHFTDLSEGQAESLTGLIGENLGHFSSFSVFWDAPNSASIYIDGSKFEVANLSGLQAMLPKVFRIDPSRALPDSVPISYLLGRRASGNKQPGVPRVERLRLTDAIIERIDDLSRLRGDPAAFGQVVSNLLGEAGNLGSMSEREAELFGDQLDLAYDLLITVGGIDLSAFEELHDAVRSSKEGLANGIIARMNSTLEESLNLAKWWSQDNLFRMAIGVRDYDVVFTVRDRTDSEYSFAERSSGLKYFLSYLVQFLAHIKDRTGPEVLLMDEPDAYLSNQGQQDLLRVFKEFIPPTAHAPSGQVVYVTHSPFLIDKNRADRLRVLDKGSGEEGVRVVRDVGRNHFEPLRTALGGSLGESAFIGNCNIIVEGVADQVYLAGMSQLLTRPHVADIQRLDLNRTTLIPAGSASHVAYIAFLARGRDANKPAVIVLVDGDGQGDQAVKDLGRGGPRYKQLVSPEYILQLKPEAIKGVTSDSEYGPAAIEDLVPVDIALRAARAYMEELGIDKPTEFPSADDVCQLFSSSVGVFKATQEALRQAGSDLRLDKLGFARNVLEVRSEIDSASAQQMDDRFKALFAELTAMQRRAERERERDSVAARVEREKARFLADRLGTAKKSDVSVFLERIEALLDISEESEALTKDIISFRREWNLNSDQQLPIQNKDALRQRLEAMRYSELVASQPSKQKPTEGPERTQEQVV